MTYVIGAIAGAVTGYVATFVIALLIMAVLGNSELEGKRAMLAAFLFGPAGAAAGLILGILVARHLLAPGGGPFSSGASILVSILGLTAIGGAICYWHWSGRPLGQNTAAPRLHFEMRIPKQALTVDRAQGIKVTLDTSDNQMPATLKPAAAAGEAEWWMVRGEVEMYFRTSSRLLVLDLGNGAQHVFRLDLPASPGSQPDWSAWQNAHAVFNAPDQSTGAVPGANDQPELRVRVETY